MKYRSTYAMNLETPLVLPVLLFAILLATLSFPAQGAAETTDFDWQETFATPAEAGQALLAANQANDQEALVRILGPESRAMLSSGDPAEDQASRQSFVAKYRQMNRWVTMIDGTQVLYIGADTGYIHLSNRTTSVRTARVYRGTSLCNWRAHGFAQSPEIQNISSAQHKQELGSITAHSVSQLCGASVVTCPSFLAQSWQTLGGSRLLRYSSHGGCHVHRHRYGTK